MASRKPATLIIGMDEAGRGPWAGPVVAACVMLQPRFPTRLLKDSKLLSSLQREKAYQKIIDTCQYGVGVIDNTVIDRIGIKKATEAAMQEALDQFLGSGQWSAISDDKEEARSQKLEAREESNQHENAGKNNVLSPLSSVHENITQPTSRGAGGILSKVRMRNLRSKTPESNKYPTPIYHLLVDGNDKFSFSLPHQSIIKGDQKIKAISAASIIAKVWRDRLMEEYHKMYRDYGFDRHKGYGTALHVENLKKHGVCPIHRISYKPVQTYLGSSVIS